MRKSSIATDTSRQPATKRTEPAAQLQAQSAQRPASWQQLSFDLNVMTWKEEMEQKKRAK